MHGILQIFFVSQYSIDDERLRQPYVEEAEMHEMLRMLQQLQVVALVDCGVNQIPKNQLEHQLVRRFSSHTKNKSIKQNKRAKSEDQDKPFSNELHELLCDFVKKTCLPKGKIFKKFTYDLILRIHSFPY